jgi:hypothetical protein
MVGNGPHIHCAGFCPNTPINLQNTPFHIPFYLFPIEGADVVLGMQWLRTLGKIDADFSFPVISFVHQNTVVTLQGVNNNMPSPSTLHHISHLLHTHSIASMHLLTSTPKPKLNTTINSAPQLPKTLPPTIQKLLQQYPNIFKLHMAYLQLDLTTTKSLYNPTPPPSMSSLTVTPTLKRRP